MPCGAQRKGQAFWVGGRGALGWEQSEGEACSTRSSCLSVGALSPQSLMGPWSLAPEVASNYGVSQKAILSLHS